MHSQYNPLRRPTSRCILNNRTEHVDGEMIFDEKTFGTRRSLEDDCSGQHSQWTHLF